MQSQKYAIRLLWFSLCLHSCGNLSLDITDEELCENTPVKPHDRTKRHNHDSIEKAITVHESFTKATSKFRIEQSSDGLEDSAHTLPVTPLDGEIVVPIVSRSAQVVLSCTCGTSAVHESSISVQLVGDTKIPSLPYVASFGTPEAAQKAIEAYLARWDLETPSGRVAIWEQGKNMLRSVEVLKKETKRSYRRQVLSFETNDIDPLVWDQVFQQQQATQRQLAILRGLRSRLLDTLQFNNYDIETVGLRTTTSIEIESVALYSSDEETQQLSDQSRKNHAAFVVGVGKVLQKHAKRELLTLLDNTIGTTIAPYVILSSTPELPELLKEYVDHCLQQEADEEKGAELLGSLLAEAILQYFVLPKVKKTRLDKMRHELGQAAYKVTLHCNQSRSSSPGKTPKST